MSRIMSSALAFCHDSMSTLLAQTRSVDRIKECLSLEAKRKTSARTEYFAFLTKSDIAAEPQGATIPSRG